MEEEMEGGGDGDGDGGSDVWEVSNGCLLVVGCRWFWCCCWLLLHSNAYDILYIKLSTEESWVKTWSYLYVWEFFSDDVDVFWSTLSFFGVQSDCWIGKKMVLSM